MATNLSNEIKKATTSTKKEVAKNNDNVNEIEMLKEKNKEMESKMDSIISLLQSLKTEKNANKEEDTSTNNVRFICNTNDDDNIPDEPVSNKMIGIMSLFFGTLNLSEDGMGRNNVSFSKYGEVKKVMYSSLVNIVNSNRSFAENGYFYIMDKASVYHLGLTDFYEHIVPKDVIKNICNYPDSDVVNIIKTITNSQKEILCESLENRMYNGETFDLNKINLISKETNIDILKKTEEMKSFNK